jgi:hypothetical protein
MNVHYNIITRKATNTRKRKRKKYQLIKNYSISIWKIELSIYRNKVLGGIAK